VVDTPADPASLEEEDWGAMVVDWQLLLEEDVPPSDASTAAAAPAAPSLTSHSSLRWWTNELKERFTGTVGLQNFMKMESTLMTGQLDSELLGS